MRPGRAAEPASAAPFEAGPKVAEPRPLVIVGAGMQAEEASYYFGTLGGRRIDAHVVDTEYLRELSFASRPVLAFDDARRRFGPATHDVFVAIGMLSMEARKRWCATAAQAGYGLASFVHPTAAVAANVSVGRNTLVKELAAVAPFVRLGDDLIIYPHVTISHHTQVGSHCFFGPGALISGGVTIGECCFFGTGAIVRDRVKVGDGCIIGAGALIMRDCPAGGVHRGAAAPAPELPPTA